MNIVKLNIIEYNEVLIALWTYICDRWAFLKQYVVSFRWSNVLHAQFKNAQLIVNMHNSTRTNEYAVMLISLRYCGSINIWKGKTVCTWKAIGCCTHL